MTGIPDHAPGPDHPSAPINLRDIIEALRASANDTRASAEAAVSAGFRAAPDKALMRRVECLDAAEKLLAIVYPYWDEVKWLIRRKRDGFSR